MGGRIDPKTGEVVWEFAVPPEEQVAHYLAHPPSGFSCMRLTPTSLPDYPFDGHGEPVETVFSMQCNCGGKRFTLLTYVEVDEGEAWEMDPFSAICGDCRESRIIFDFRSHGYDGALGHNSWKGEPTGDPVELKSAALGPGPWEIIVRFEYGSDVLGSKDFPDWVGKEQDLFTWMTIVGKLGDQVATVLEWECA